MEQWDVSEFLGEEQDSKRPAPKLGRLTLPDLIIYEDEALVVVSKPAGLSSLQERNSPARGLLDLARRHNPDLRLCHRLDKWTTGVLVMAKTDDAFRAVALQFQRRETVKHYLALVKGAAHFEAQEVDAPLSPLERSGVVRVDYKEGKPALTLLQTAQLYRHYTLIDAAPVTGRGHQIRVHLAHVGFPLVGDELYGGAPLLLSEIKGRRYKLSDDAERPLNDGYLLHAFSLTLTHPSTGEEVTFEAPLSKNFEACLKVLARHDAVVL